MTDISMIPFILPSSLSDREHEFRQYLKKAYSNIREFSLRYGWEEHTSGSFTDKVMIFDSKPEFNKVLLELCGMPADTDLPDTYSAALEQRIFTAVSPELYLKNYPDGDEPDFYIKLITHEIAHRLHVRILNGDEEAMGPVWFFEGFALFAADQFAEPRIELTADEMCDIIGTEERGSYEKYAYIFRHVLKYIPLQELVSDAGSQDFNQRIIKNIRS